MKSARILFALSLAVPAIAAADEGVATFKYNFQGKESGPDGQAVIWFSPNAYVSEMQMSMRGGPNTRSGQGMPQAFKMKMLQKFSEPDKIYSINDEARTYSVMDLSKNRDSAMEKETYTVKKLGTMQIAGLSCQNALVTSSKGSQMEVCVTNDVNLSANWLAAMTRQQGRTGNWGKALVDAGIKAGFPIRWTAKSKEGTGEAVMELVKVEKKPVPASMFQIPAGYRETGGGLVTGAMTPEQQKQIDDALAKLTPEQRKAYEDMMKAQQGKKE
jgi:hypothetical protein